MIVVFNLLFMRRTYPTQSPPKGLLVMSIGFKWRREERCTKKNDTGNKVLLAYMKKGISGETRKFLDVKKEGGTALNLFSRLE